MQEATTRRGPNRSTVLRLVLGNVVGLVFGLAATPTTANYAYDAAPLTRVEVDVTTTTGSALPHLSEPSAQRVERLSAASGASTTPDVRSNATNTGDEQITKATSPTWQSFKPFRGPIKANGLTGSKKEFYTWDYTHCDIEVFDKNGNHKGSMDPKTDEMTKPAVPGRRIQI